MCVDFLYNRKVLLSYYIKRGVTVPCRTKAGAQTAAAVIEGNLGFPSESVPRGYFYARCIRKHGMRRIILIAKAEYIHMVIKRLDSKGTIDIIVLLGY